MRNRILLASAAALAAGLLAASVGCDSGGSGITADNTPTETSVERCGNGTYLDTGSCRCLPRPGTGAAPAAAPLKSVQP